MHITVKGLVIRETDFGESDRYITFLTENSGKIEVLCKGVRRRGGHNTAAVRLFCFSELTLFESRGRYSLNEGVVLRQFWGIAEDIEKYALCCYFSQLADLAADADDGAPELLTLFLYALYALSEKPRPLWLVKAAFEMRLMSRMGFTPDLTGCAACRREAPEKAGYSLLLEEGVLICSGCKNRIGGTYYFLTEGALAALRHIVTCPVEKLFRFSVGEQTASLLERVCEAFTLYRTEKEFSALQFYHSLFPDREKRL